MDWHSVTFDWNQARAFLVTAEEGSLSAAARALGLTQPTLGRQVAALEEELGVALLERTGREQVLTPAGLELIEHVRAMGMAAGRVSLAASGQSQSIEGPICITASEAYSTYLLPPILSDLRHDHPGIEIEIVASNAVTDLRRREADIAIRNARPTDPELVARRIVEDEGGLYAAPAYLDRIGWPETPAELNSADFIGFDKGARMVEWLNSCGMALTPESFRITSLNHVAQWAMVKAGAGIGVMSRRIGDPEPDVVRVLEEAVSITYPIWLVAHRDLNTSRRVRLVFDMLAERLAAA